MGVNEGYADGDFIPLLPIHVASHFLHFAIVMETAQGQKLKNEKPAQHCSNRKKWKRKDYGVFLYVRDDVHSANITNFTHASS